MDIKWGYKKRTDTMSVGLMATGAGENENIQ